MRPRVERVFETVLKQICDTACIDVRKPECDQDSTVFWLLGLNLKNCVNDLNKLWEKYVGLLCDLKVDPKWGLNIALRESCKPRTCNRTMEYYKGTEQRLGTSCKIFLEHCMCKLMEFPIFIQIPPTCGNYGVFQTTFSPQHVARLLCRDCHTKINKKLVKTKLVPPPSNPLSPAVPLTPQLLDDPQSRP